MGIQGYWLNIVVHRKHVVLNGMHLNLSIEKTNDNDFIVSKNFLDEAVYSFAGEPALA